MGKSILDQFMNDDGLWIPLYHLSLDWVGSKLENEWWDHKSDDLKSFDIFASLASFEGPVKNSRERQRESLWGDEDKESSFKSRMNEKD